MRTSLRFLTLVLASLVAVTAAAQNNSVQAVRLLPGEQLSLDGSLSHPAWQRAPVFSRFVEKFPNTGGPPSEETRVQVMFDDHALWVGVTALDKNPARISDVPVRNDRSKAHV